MEKNKLVRDVRFLKMYAIISTALFVFIITTSFYSMNKRPRFQEIDVERINVVEKNGQVRMVISNQGRQHPHIIDGEIIKRDNPRPPGIIFFNHSGDEIGGLVYGENDPDNHFGSITWDKPKGGPTIGFRHVENEDGKYLSGLSVWNQPNIPSHVMLAKKDSVFHIKNEAKRKEAMKALRDANLLSTHRLFLGKSLENVAMLQLLDMNGQTRLVVMVDADGAPKILFFNEKGKLTHTLPE